MRLQRLYARLRAIGQWKRKESEIEEELQFHLSEEMEERTSAGLSQDEARRAARRDFGNAALIREDTRNAWRWPSFDSLAQDLRFGWRLLGKNRLSTVASILSLSLAIGACTAVFSLVDAMVLRPLPVWQPERLVHLSFPHPGEGIEIETFSYPLFERMRAAGRPYVDLFGVAFQHPRRTIIDPRTGPEKLRVQFVSGDLFHILGVRPFLGRLLTASDDQKPGAHPVAVLSHALWTRRFGKDPAVLGRWIRVDEQDLQVIGVAEERFTGTEVGILTDIWLPNMMFSRPAFTTDGWSWFMIWGRLKLGASATQAREVLQSVFTENRRERAKGLRAEESREMVEKLVNTRLNVWPATTGASRLRKDFERPLWILAAVVGLVLLIACANVANLLLARASSREREMAVRVSIGASRGRLIRQLISESFVLALLSSTAGIAMAVWAAPAIVRLLAPSDAPAWLALGPDWRVLGFLVVLSVLATLLFGLAPSLGASSATPHTAMKSGDNRVVRSGLGRLLVGAQVGFCCVLLFIAGLFVLSFQKLVTTDLGFRRDHVVLLNVVAPELRNQQAAAPAYWEQLRERVRGIPGVASASLSGWALMGGSSRTDHVRVNGKASQGEEIHFLTVSPSFFETMRIGILSGREFETRDIAVERPNVAIVNETFARRYFDGENPVGRIFESYASRDRLDSHHVVGLVRDAKYRSVRDKAPPTVYLPLRPIDYGLLEIRTALDPGTLTGFLREELPKIHPSFQIHDVTTQAALVENTIIRERLLAALSGFFAILATVLAAVGLYSVLNYAVVQRTNEIGLRMALGANAREVVGLVVREVMWTVVGGVAGGLLCGYLVQRFITTLLYGVRATDPVAIALPCAVLFGAAILASVPPALRAARVDPMIALRYE